MQITCRFKDLADSAAAAAAAGTYTIEDEEYVQMKAKAIIDCYIDSQIPPKLQVRKKPLISRGYENHIFEYFNHEAPVAKCRQDNLRPFMGCIPSRDTFLFASFLIGRFRYMFLTMCICKKYV